MNAQQNIEECDPTNRYIKVHIKYDFDIELI